MPLLTVSLVLCVLVPALVGGLLALRAGRAPVPGALAASLSRLAVLREAIVATLGRPLGAFLVVTSGSGVALLALWPVGVLARALEDSVDVPAFEWVQSHADPHALVTRLSTVATHMGNWPQLKVIAVVAAVAVAGLWAVRKMAWWYVPVLVYVALWTEKHVQKLLAVVIDRGHPPTTMGTFPSGGVTRTVLFYGLVVYLVTLALPGLSRRTRVLLATVPWVLGFVEAFTRVHLLKHWFTDVPPGLLLGGILLATMVAATRVLVPRVPPRHQDVPAGADDVGNADGVLTGRP